MLFNSYIFIFVFLPCILFLYYFFVCHDKILGAKVALIIASLIFYGYYNPYYLLILCSSILINYFISRRMFCVVNNTRKTLMVMGVALNVLVLFVFKYFNFFIENINLLFRTEFNIYEIVLPLGISFFTFQQISYIVDSYHGETKDYNFIDYCLFVTFFPQLVAGPIVLHDEMIPQFKNISKKINWDAIALGIEVLILGLFKKVIVADTFGNAVNWGYNNLETLSSVEAMMITLGYTLQIYFDFSGYCDMAFGIAKLFNINIPINFDSPYKSTSISEFWRRWHITLNRFLTRYIYIPLGGSKKGKLWTCKNTLIVFLISGIWHGANWTFIVWGGLHGIAVMLNKLFKEQWEKIPKVLGWFTTFIFVNFAWIFFRADSVQQALIVIAKIFAFDMRPVREELVDIFNLSEVVLLERIFKLNVIIEKLHINNMRLFFALSLIAILFTEPCVKKVHKSSIMKSLELVVLFVWIIISLSSVSIFLYFGF